MLVLRVPAGMVLGMRKARVEVVVWGMAECRHFASCCKLLAYALIQAPMYS